MLALLVYLVLTVVVSMAASIDQLPPLSQPKPHTHSMFPGSFDITWFSAPGIGDISPIYMKTNPVVFDNRLAAIDPTYRLLFLLKQQSLDDATHSWIPFDGTLTLLNSDGEAIQTHSIPGSETLREGQVPGVTIPDGQHELFHLFQLDSLPLPTKQDLTSGLKVTFAASVRQVDRESLQTVKEFPLPLYELGTWAFEFYEWEANHDWSRCPQQTKERRKFWCGEPMQYRHVTCQHFSADSSLSRTADSELCNSVIPRLPTTQPCPDLGECTGSDICIANRCTCPEAQREFGNCHDDDDSPVYPITFSAENGQNEIIPGVAKRLILDIAGIDEIPTVSFTLFQDTQIIASQALGYFSSQIFTVHIAQADVNAEMTKNLFHIEVNISGATFIQTLELTVLIYEADFDDVWCPWTCAEPSTEIVPKCFLVKTIPLDPNRPLPEPAPPARCPSNGPRPTPCQSSPCLNGGICERQPPNTHGTGGTFGFSYPPSFDCTCPPGSFTGDRCEDPLMPENRITKLGLWTEIKGSLTNQISNGQLIWIGFDWEGGPSEQSELLVVQLWRPSTGHIQPLFENRLPKRKISIISPPEEIRPKPEHVILPQIQASAGLVFAWIPDLIPFFLTEDRGPLVLRARLASQADDVAWFTFKFIEVVSYRWEQRDTPCPTDDFAAGFASLSFGEASPGGALCGTRTLQRPAICVRDIVSPKASVPVSDTFCSHLARPEPQVTVCTWPACNADGGLCNGVTNRCVCNPPFSGARCQLRKCPAGSAQTQQCANGGFLAALQPITSEDGRSDASLCDGDLECKCPGFFANPLVNPGNALPGCSECQLTAHCRGSSDFVHGIASKDCDKCVCSRKRFGRFCDHRPVYITVTLGYVPSDLEPPPGHEQTATGQPQNEYLTAVGRAVDAAARLHAGPDFFLPEAHIVRWQTSTGVAKSIPSSEPVSYPVTTLSDDAADSKSSNDEAPIVTVTYALILAGDATPADFHKSPALQALLTSPNVFNIIPPMAGADPNVSPILSVSGFDPNCHHDVGCGLDPFSDNDDESLGPSQPRNSPVWIAVLISALTAGVLSLIMVAVGVFLCYRTRKCCWATDFGDSKHTTYGSARTGSFFAPPASSIQHGRRANPAIGYNDVATTSHYDQGHNLPPLSGFHHQAPPPLAHF